MRTPTRSMARNLRWTRSGTVWADWILTGLPYGLRPTKDKHGVRMLHQALIRALPGESLLLGLCAGLDPAAVVDRMLTNVDPETARAWLAECEATLDTLDQIGPGERVYWLSVPLGNNTNGDRVKEPLRAASDELRDTIGLPRSGMSPEVLARRLEQAEMIRANLPAPFQARPATPAQMLWLDLHTQQRGLFRDRDLPTAQDGIDEDLAAGLARARSTVAVGEPLLDEGGQTDLNRKQRMQNWNPGRRRFLKVVRSQEVAEVPASYQAMLVLSDVPTGAISFPGGEFLGRIDESGLDVDWAVRLTVRSSAQVRAANQRALRNLNEQYGQREDELSHGVSTLDQAADALAEYAAILQADKHEVETQATVFYAVAGPTADSATTQARALADWYAPTGYKLAQPLGYQNDMWWAMTPGVPSGRVVREFAQITTSRSLACAVPLASVQLGDNKGSLLALNISHGPMLDHNLPCGPTGVVLHDLEGASDRDVSGSIVIAGELGAGKSLTIKKLGGDVVDRGGRVLAADRTPMGEYAVWADSVTDAVVVNIAAPAVSLDPLRIFGPVQGSRITQTFLTPLLNVSPTAPWGVLLSDVLAPDYLARYAISGMGTLLRHLETECGLPEATEVARLMNVFARRDFGRVIFDETLPPLELTARAIVIRTHTLELPNSIELEHAHLFQQMGLEKIFGRAAHALIAGIARSICFADPQELAVFVADEFHAFTMSFEGIEEFTVFVRDGRKHNAALIAGTHDPEGDIASTTLRGLIPTRILMRHRDKTLAARGLKWLDLDPTDEALLDLIRSDTSPVTANGVQPHRRGECLIRDSSGNVGRAKILMPAVAARARAALTSPNSKQSLTAPAAAAPDPTAQPTRVAITAEPGGATWEKPT